MNPPLIDLEEPRLKSVLLCFRKREEDSFTILVEADLETKGFYNEAKLRQDLKDHVDDHQRLGSYALIPQEFKFKKFIG